MLWYFAASVRSVTSVTSVRSVTSVTSVRALERNLPSNSCPAAFGLSSVICLLTAGLLACCLAGLLPCPSNSCPAAFGLSSVICLLTAALLPHCPAALLACCPAILVPCCLAALLPCLPSTDLLFGPEYRPRQNDLPVCITPVYQRAGIHTLSLEATGAL